MTRRGGKQVRVQLGEFPEVNLGEARRRARHVLEVKTQDGAEGVATPDDDIIPLMRALCEDYVEQMKARKGRDRMTPIIARSFAVSTASAITWSGC